jgi:hypothetical protein
VCKVSRFPVQGSGVRIFWSRVFASFPSLIAPSTGLFP